jgi:hypothetical protein
MKALLGFLILMAACLAAAADFAGTYTAKLGTDVFRLEIKQDAVNVTGTLTQGKGTIRLKGRVQGARVVGTCDDETGLELGFRLERKDGKMLLTLVFDDEGEVEEILKVSFDPEGGPAKKADDPKKVDAGKAEAGATEAGKSALAAKAKLAKEQRLMWGTTLSHPESWSVKYVTGAAQLVPPASKQTEVYSLPVIMAPAGVKADGEALGELLKEHLAEVTKGMNLIANKALPTNGGPGRLVAYEGTGPQGPVRLHFYLTIQGGLAVGILAVGASKDILARADELTKIFATFDLGAASIDPRLAGAWVFQRNEYSSTDSRGYGGTRFSRTVELAADGRLAMQTSSRAYMSGDGISIDTGPSVKTLTGRWFAFEGMIVVVTEDGETSYYDYQLSEGVLRLTDAQGKRDLYSRAG